MSALSNTLAQVLNVYREGLSAIDPVAFLHFIILAIITTPPNYKWQLWLEETFPSHPRRAVSQNAEKKQDDKPAKEEKPALSVTNTVAKFLLDQSFGAGFNTIWFIVMLNLLKGQSFEFIMTTARNVSFTHGIPPGHH
jgi:protein Mpv17